jgi:4-hydroxy-2-oxoheptanedioate aldolase
MKQRTEPVALPFKEAVRTGPQFGLSCAIPSHHTVEILGASAYDFLLIDAEHPPTNPAIVHAQLMALAGRHCRCGSCHRLHA